MIAALPCSGEAEIFPEYFGWATSGGANKLYCCLPKQCRHSPFGAIPALSYDALRSQAARVDADDCGGGSKGRNTIFFGPFSLDVSKRLLIKEGAPVELGARALDILIALTSRPNAILSKRELISEVWPDVTVEEGSLRFHINALRKAMGDGKDGASYIITVAGRGYCSVAPVAQADETANNKDTEASPLGAPISSRPAWFEWSGAPTMFPCSRLSSPRRASSQSLAPEGS